VNNKETVGGKGKGGERGKFREKWVLGGKMRGCGKKGIIRCF
jgi:hypothetical protein